MNFILIPLSNGQVAALLTGFECAITMITGFCLNFIFENLPERKHSQNKRSKKVKKEKLREILNFLLVIFTCISVFFVEYNMNVLLKKSLRKINLSRFLDTHGIPMDSYDGTRPPSMYNLDEESAQFAKSLACDHGLKEIPLQESKVLGTKPYHFIYPNCFGNSSLLHRFDKNNYSNSTTSLNIPNSFLGSYRGIRLKRVGFSIVPYTVDPMLLSNSTKFILESAEICEKKGIDFWPTIYREGWNIGFASEEKSSSMMLRKFCELQTARSIPLNDSYFKQQTEMKAEVVRNCTVQTERRRLFQEKKVDHDCVKENFEQLGMEEESVVFKNVSAILMSGSKIKPVQSVVCFNANVKLHYIKVPVSSFDFLMNRKISERSMPNAMLRALIGESDDCINSAPYTHEKAHLEIILPTKITALSGIGHCENSFASLSLAAMIYSSHAGWINNSFSPAVDLTVRQRYYAYTISMYRYHYRYESFFENKREEAKEFSISEKFTKINVDLFFTSLVFIQIICFVIIVTAILMMLNLYSSRFFNYSYYFK